MNARPKMAATRKNQSTRTRTRETKRRVWRPKKWKPVYVSES